MYAITPRVAGRIRTSPSGLPGRAHRVRIWPDSPPAPRRSCPSSTAALRRPITRRSRACQGVSDQAQGRHAGQGRSDRAGIRAQGPGVEDGTLSFRVYRDPANADYLLFVEHFADQAAYDAHTSSPAYQDLIAGQFADAIVEFVEIDHELVIAL